MVLYFSGTGNSQFVAPTYSWRIPKVVEQWISETEFNGNQNDYFVLTC